jgi:hypothetical protein
MEFNKFSQKTLTLFSRVDAVEISHLVFKDVARGMVEEWAFSFPSVEDRFVVYHMSSLATHMREDMLFIPYKGNSFHIETCGGEEFYTL